MDTSKKLRLLAAALLVGSGLFWLACTDDSSAVKEPAVVPDSGTSADTGTLDGGGGDASVDGAPSDCFTNPTTYVEIINACTDAVRLQKNPTLPLLYPDGGLPPHN